MWAGSQFWKACRVDLLMSRLRTIVEHYSFPLYLSQFHQQLQNWSNKGSLYVEEHKILAHLYWIMYFRIYYSWGIIIWPHPERGGECYKRDLFYNPGLLWFQNAILINGTCWTWLPFQPQSLACTVDSSRRKILDWGVRWCSKSSEASSRYKYVLCKLWSVSCGRARQIGLRLISSGLYSSMNSFWNIVHCIFRGSKTLCKSNCSS